MNQQQQSPVQSPRAYIISELSRYYSNMEESRWQHLIENSLDYFRNKGIDPFNFQFNEFKEVINGEVRYRIDWIRREDTGTAK